MERTILQQENGWGKSIVQVLSKELQNEFPGAKMDKAETMSEKLDRLQNNTDKFMNHNKLNKDRGA